MLCGASVLYTSSLDYYVVCSTKVTPVAWDTHLNTSCMLRSRTGLNQGQHSASRPAPTNVYYVGVKVGLLTRAQDIVATDFLELFSTLAQQQAFCAPRRPDVTSSMPGQPMYCAVHQYIPKEMTSCAVINLLHATCLLCTTQEHQKAEPTADRSSVFAGAFTAFFGKSAAAVKPSAMHCTAYDTLLSRELSLG